MKPEESKPSKKPYKAPKLVHLGSVRELTAAATGSVIDGHLTAPNKKKVVM